MSRDMTKSETSEIVDRRPVSKFLKYAGKHHDCGDFLVLFTPLKHGGGLAYVCCLRCSVNRPGSRIWREGVTE